VRIDHGIEEGGEVTPYYDAMVAKFIAHGRDRADALRRLVRALEDAPLLGVRNNGRFLRDLLRTRSSAAAMTTTRLDEWAAAGEPLLQRPHPPEAAWRVAAALRAARRAPQRGPGSARPASPASTSRCACGGQTRTLRAPVAGVTCCRARGRRAALRARRRAAPRRCVAEGERLHLAIDGAVFSFTEPSPYPTATTADPRAPAPRWPASWRRCW
jgi:geranyl-CoA carboxylase alpha subunit